MNFDKKSSLYDKFAVVQRKSADVIMQMVNDWRLDQVDNIVDIGAGTGFLTELIYNKYQDSKIDAIDVSGNSLQILKNKNVNINTIHGDFSSYHFHKVYDIAVSNFCFQWADDIEKWLLKIKKISRISIIAMPILGSFSDIDYYVQKYNFVNNFIDFLPLEKIINILHRNNIAYSYDIANFNVVYNSFYDFLKSIKNIGATIDCVNNNSLETMKKIRYKHIFKANYKTLFLILN